jgi:uncharacterized protein (DUF1499 family)
MPHPWLTTNDVTTDRAYAVPATRVFAEAEAVCRALPRWTVTKTDPVEHTLSAEVRTAFGGFTDDVTVSVIPAGSAAARVTVRSRSRVGRGDLGENARHVRALLRTLDALLPRAQE